jgi:hypothetical protein
MSLFSFDLFFLFLSGHLDRSTRRSEPDDWSERNGWSLRIITEVVAASALPKLIFTTRMPQTIDSRRAGSSAADIRDEAD